MDLHDTYETALQGGAGAVNGEDALMADAAAEASLEGHLPES